MELRHLRYFVSVAEAASVSKAALQLNICQPALSRQIRDLEAELGVRLFDRVGRRIQLTALGEDLVRQSRDVLAHAESLVERARTLVGGFTGVLRVGATPQAMQSVVAGFLPKFQRARPGVELRLTEDGGVRLYELVKRGELHLALSGILAGWGLESRPLFPIRVLAVTARGARWKRRTTIEAAELANEPLLVLSRDFGSRQLFDAACRIAQLRPRIVLESREPHTLISLAEAGQGIAVVPSTVQFVSSGIHIHAVAPRGEVTRSLGRPGVGSAALVAHLRNEIRRGIYDPHFSQIPRKALRPHGPATSTAIHGRPLTQGSISRNVLLGSFDLSSPETRR